MRVSLAFTGLIVLLAAGCAQVPQDSEDAANSAATTEPATDAAPEALSRTDDELYPIPPSRPVVPGEVPPTPDISPDVAPDLAFGYKYSFGLAADQVAPVQQRHARLCEELGAERCRVTGMNFRRERNGDATADLKLALEPGLAHRFGERALDSVRDAEGELLDSLVSGTDVGSGIRASTRTLAQLEEQLADLEQQIARGGSRGTLRDLRAEAEALRARIQALRTDRGDKREQLATTPMSFSYTSDYVPAGSAAARLTSVMSVLAPFLALGGLIWLAFWQSRRRRGPYAPPAADAAA